MQWYQTKQDRHGHGSYVIEAMHGQTMEETASTVQLYRQGLSWSRVQCGPASKTVLYVD